jgi:acetyl-CoA carboxylase carboxyl transferase subunit beta
MKDFQRQLPQLEERILYLQLIKDHPSWGNLDGFKKKCEQLKTSANDHTEESLTREIRQLDESITFLEERAEEHLTPMELVRIARSSERFSLKDILENVYDDYIELGGEDDANVDPAMICARATISRHIKDRRHNASVMVIGQEHNHGEPFRSAGSCTPQGNEKALKYMKVAESEGIPIHFFIFTPGTWPTEEGPGAAQQITRNIYTMAKLRVPMISMISEGGGGGAEAIGLSDYRIMASHGYYSVIPPERAAAIEGKISEGSTIPKELIEVCANRLRLTAEDNLILGTVDQVIQEPHLGARKDDSSFFAALRTEMIRATDKVILSVKSFSGLRNYEIRRRKHRQPEKEDQQPSVTWDLGRDEIKRLLAGRSRKYLEMGRNGFSGQPDPEEAIHTLIKARTENVIETLRHDILKSHKRHVRKLIDEGPGAGTEMLQRITEPLTAIVDIFSRKKKEKQQLLLTYSGTTKVQDDHHRRADPLELTDTYTTPLIKSDQTVSCPNSERYNCKDLWIPDLYRDFAGVCENCGHHFPLEYQWYLKSVFDPGSIDHFNGDIAAANPLNYTGFSERLQSTINRTGRRSGNITFHARVHGIELIVSMLYSDFFNGTVGSAEGEKFVQACALAGRKKRPFLACIHATGGIRFQEGCLGIIQMAKCTMAVREYIDSGGLYLVVYDNNCYAGPLASFLGCSPYQFAIKSSRVGFAGPREIRETTGNDIPPDYHSARNGLKRGHIQGIWDRREFKRNLHKALLRLGRPGLCA